MKRPSNEEIAWQYAKKFCLGLEQLYASHAIERATNRPFMAAMFMAAINKSHKFDNIPEKMGPMTQEGNR